VRSNVLLGILAMGFIFDRFGAKSDEEQLQELLARNVRLLAQLTACPLVQRGGAAVWQFSRLRRQINDNFANLESEADAVRYESEFRNRREKDVGECERILRAQPALRSIYLLELSLHSLLAQREIASELRQQGAQALDRFLKEFSEELMHIAAWIAGNQAPPVAASLDSIRQLQHANDNHTTPNSQAILDLCQKMVFSLNMLQHEC
jgi:hypothetical protein